MGFAMRQEIWVLSVWDGDTPISYLHTSESDAWMEALRIILGVFQDEDRARLIDWHSAGKFEFVKKFLDAEFPCNYVFRVEQVFFEPGGFPQGLKPSPIDCVCGTTEVVP